MISVEHLSFQYPEQDALALNDVSLCVPENVVFGLLGPNGAGKTTLLSILVGLLCPSQGEVVVGGLDLRSSLADIRRFSASVPQDFAFYPSLSARENLVFFGGVLGLFGRVLAQRVDFCLEVAGLRQVVDQQACFFSGGLKRRLNLAIGLLGKPKVVYLDEPTVGVDPQSRHFLLESFKHLKDEGVTVVYTSHYMEEVEFLCDEVAIIDRGSILVSGALDELLLSGSSGKLIVVVDRLLSDVELRALGEVVLPVVTGVQLCFDLGRDVQRISELLRVLAGFGVVVRSVQYGHHDLEQLFMSLTNTKLRD